MSDDYRVNYVGPKGEHEHLDGKCHGAIRNSPENDALIKCGYRFSTGHRIYRREPSPQVVGPADE